MFHPCAIVLFVNVSRNTFSCFDGGEVGQFSILDDVYKQIEDRAHHPVEKSYTNYLLDSGVDKICKKVGEEATEAIIAAKNNDKEELIGEIADLSYHLLVLMYQQGLTLDDLKAKLVERHQVQGNLKTKNTKGDY
jgi:phosphoribosyl-ATP pyrophosphohydrolase/phosphoribosyl-AMP cyclohydrolase